MHSDLVIIGSGLAGLNLVKALRNLGDTRSITVMTQEAGHFYAKPLLSNALSKGKTPDTLPVQNRMDFAAQYAVNFLPHSIVTEVDLSARLLKVNVSDANGVALNTQQQEWENLVFATGARPVQLQELGVRVLGTPPYTVNQLSEYAAFYTELMQLKQRFAEQGIDRPVRVLIVGSGLIGCEFANDLAAQGYAVSVVDITDRPMARLLPQAQSRVLGEALMSLGVAWYWQERVVELQHTDSAYCATMASGLSLTADVVLSAVGLTAQTDLAKASGLEVGPGIRVNAVLETSASGVYALGDCATVAGVSLHYVLPLMACTRALAKTLAGTPTPVAYPAMPVVVKTPACPLVVCVPPDFSSTNDSSKDSNLSWSVTGSGADLKALLHDASGQIVGFALSGACVSEKNALANTLSAWL